MSELKTWELNHEAWSHIEEFLQWCDSNGKAVLATGSRYDAHKCTAAEIHTLMYEYFEIDPVQLEQERRNILAAFVQWREERETQ